MTEFDDMILDLHYNKDIFKTAGIKTNFFVVTAISSKALVPGVRIFLNIRADGLRRA